MYISIQAGITDITLESLDGYKTYTKNNTKISGLDGWYLLTTSNVQINDILINNESIGDLIHTGYIKNNSFHIWIHTNLGCMISCCRKVLTHFLKMQTDHIGGKTIPLIKFLLHQQLIKMKCYVNLNHN